MADLSWLDDFFGPPVFEAGGVEVPKRALVHVEGGSVADDVANKRTILTVGGGGGGAVERNLRYADRHFDPNGIGMIDNNTRCFANVDDIAAGTVERILSIACMGDYVYFTGADTPNGDGQLYAVSRSSGLAQRIATVDGAENALSVSPSRDYDRDVLLIVTPANVQARTMQKNRNFLGGPVPSNWIDSGSNFTLSPSYVTGTGTSPLARGVFVMGDPRADEDPTGEGFAVWTSPEEGRVYTNEFYDQNFSQVVGYTMQAGSTPGAICVNTENEEIWVSAPGIGKLFRFSLDPTTGLLTLLQTADLAHIDELLFDGTSLWAFDRSYAKTLYRLDAASGNVTGSCDFTGRFNQHSYTSYARPLSDGRGIWLNFPDAIVCVHPKTVTVMSVIELAGVQSMCLAPDGGFIAAQPAGSGVNFYEINQAVPLLRPVSIPRFGKFPNAQTFDFLDPTGEIYRVTGGTVTLPRGPIRPYDISFIDAVGDASSNNTTITTNDGSTINGASSYVINTDWSLVRLIWTSANNDTPGNWNAVKAAP